MSVTEKIYDDWNDPELPDILDIARHVAQGESQAPGTGKPKPYWTMFKKLAKDAPASFLSKLQSLEKDWQEYKIKREQARTLKKAEAGVAVKDVGTAEAVAQCERLIEELTQV